GVKLRVASVQFFTRNSWNVPLRMDGVGGGQTGMMGQKDAGREDRIDEGCRISSEVITGAAGAPVAVRPISNHAELRSVVRAMGSSGWLRPFEHSENFRALGQRGVKER